MSVARFVFNSGGMLVLRSRKAAGVDFVSLSSHAVKIRMTKIGTHSVGQSVIVGFLETRRGNARPCASVSGLSGVFLSF